ncbi:uncharacterized protein [Leptinotarsa decemlineata]|uniref:uncharacterized protein n=1 Tax=Leptinotarsa decemlineata TaxID=7539 RepID=UPI003D30572C
MGDFNAKSNLWTEHRADARGQYVEDWINERDMTVHNIYNEPTFIRGMQSSTIDLTLSLGRIGSKIKEWQVSREESGSLHRYILFKVEGHHKQKSDKVPHKFLGLPVFKDTIQLLGHNIHDRRGLISIVKSAQKLGSDTNNDGTNREQPVWWNENIRELRKKCHQVRRELTRLRRENDDPERVLAKDNEYKDTRRNLRRAINRSQREEWRKLCDRLEEDPWGQGYKIVVRDLKGFKAPYDIDQTKRKDILRELFPRQT